ncbi:SET domain-containing protein [Phlegmacium glaucopus]|nr:SET domain-containing protein [Phlegmacium glaucopus]
MISSQDPVLFTTIQTRDDVGPGPNSFYDIRPTAHGGRGAFARSFIPKGSLILSCSGPYASVIFRSFKREVCAWCFAYAFESGKKKWSIKLDEVNRNSAGAWFCSKSCRETWTTDYQAGDDGVGWWLDINSALEKSVAHIGKRGKTGNPATPSISRLAFLSSDDLSGEKVTQEFIDQAWSLAHEVSFEESKQGIRTEWTEELNEMEQDTVRFVLDALIRKVIDDSKSISTHRPLDDSQTQFGIGRWPDLLDLQDNELALLKSKPYLIESQLLSYRFLRHFVVASQSRTSYQGKKWKSDLTQDSMQPIEMLRGFLSTPTLTRAILGRDYGNVFGIWDTAPSDQGSEMLGWGMYVFGSYFNHDCSPNLKKDRDKRGLAFYTLRDVHPGEELCIAYIDETVSLNERIESLQKDWFFACRCTKCSREMEASSGFNASSRAMVHEGHDP